MVPFGFSGLPFGGSGAPRAATLAPRGHPGGPYAVPTFPNRESNAFVDFGTHVFQLFKFKKLEISSFSGLFPGHSFYQFLSRNFDDGGSQIEVFSRKVSQNIFFRDPVFYEFRDRCFSFLGGLFFEHVLRCHLDVFDVFDVFDVCDVAAHLVPLLQLVVDPTLPLHLADAQLGRGHLGE